MKIKVIRCPLCCMELPVDIFLHHMASDHDIEAISLQDLNVRLKIVGFPNVEIYETDKSEEKRFFV